MTIIESFEEESQMNVDSMKTIRFQETNHEEWQEVAVKSLRGMPFDKLITKTIEGIDLQPLYTKENAKLNPSTNKIREAHEKNWIIAQAQYGKSGEVYISNLMNSLSRGNEAIVYNGDEQIKWTAESLKKFADLAMNYPIYFKNIKKDDSVSELFDLIAEADRSKVFGAVSFSHYKLPKGYSNVRTVGADITSAHLNGADAVTELALVIAQAAEHALDFKSFADFNKQFFVRFSIDTHFFMEMAKIRAFRLLWKTVGDAFGEQKVMQVPVLCETSLRSYSKLDPYVNLLRAGNEAFSAVLGGADVITVHPHDLLTGSTATSERLARNVQLVIREETVVNEVIDPAGGSYYIETLTTELVEQAWQYFLLIEQEGGYTKYVENGVLDERLQKLSAIRHKAISTSEYSLIGTNVYADLDSASLGANNNVKINNRLAEPFEKLRNYFTQTQPNTVLLNFGELKDFKPRADFVSGFLAVGGIRSRWSPTFSTVEEAIVWLKEEMPDYVIVCGEQENVKTIMPDLLKGKLRNLLIDVAGKYEEVDSNNWMKDGLNGFIYSGQDNIHKLSAIKTSWEDQ